LHWSISTGRADVSVEGPTVHLTRSVPPPPVPASLHWVTVALVVLAGKGSHAVVGWVPPPVPLVLHWLTVTGTTSGGVAAAGMVMLFTRFTLQVTVPPPPLPEPLHWSTVVVSWSDGVVVVVHGSAALAAPWHSVTVTVELVSPVARLMLFVMVVSQATAWPPTLSVPLH